MATRAAAAPAKKVVQLTEENYEKFDESGFQRLECCAFVEFSGLDGLKTVEDFVAVRRAASGDVGDLDEVYSHFADDGTNGMVLVTTSSSQSAKYPLLTAAGFDMLAEFTRPSPTRTIRLWGARTLKPGKVTKAEEVEMVSI